jgi:hypothetical protein
MSDIPNIAQPVSRREQPQRPAMAIGASFISMFSLILIVGIHIHNIFCGGNWPGPRRYYTTLALVLVSGIYLRFHGRALMRKWLPRRHGQMVLTKREIMLVIGLVLFFDAYLTWIFSG